MLLSSPVYDSENYTNRERECVFSESHLLRCNMLDENQINRYLAALKAMKGQAAAVTENLPNKPNHQTLCEAQSQMSAYPSECSAIYKLVMKNHVPIPELTEKQLLAWLESSEATA